MCCKSNSEERSARNPHATFCGGWGIHRMPLLPSTGGGIPPVYLAEKAPRKVSGEVQGGERKRTTGEVSKRIRRRQNWGLTELQDRSKRDLLTAWAASGIKVART